MTKREMNKMVRQTKKMLKERGAAIFQEQIEMWWKQAKYSLAFVPHNDLPYANAS